MGKDLSNNAVGLFSLDSAALTNGRHAIYWIVTATSGGAAGVGSRYITVSNGNLMLDPSPVISGVIAAHPKIDMPLAAMSRLGGPASLGLESDALAASTLAIEGRRGSDLDAPFEKYEPVDGWVVVQAEELDRIELRLGSGGGHEFSGYLRTGGGLRPLPIGSVIDPETGIFTWGAGPGFVGAYDLVFVQWSQGQAIARQDVRVVLNPKGSGKED